jgi:hypothetical protein
MTVWDFLRDEQNREALKTIGAAVAALAFAGWTLYQDRRAQRQINALAGELEQIKAVQADLLRGVERSDRRHDLLFGVVVGKTVIKREARVDEPPADTSK